MTSIENLGHENRKFPPSAQFVAQANAKPSLFDEAKQDRLKFWEREAENLSWDKKDRKSTRLNSSHSQQSRMPSSA